MPRRAELTGKQQEFVRQFLLDLNATAAYKRAGYRPRSDNAAAAAASALLRNRKVADAIAVAQQARAVRTETTADDVVRGLRTEAEYYGDGANHGARVTAWTQLGKHLGMFPEKVRRHEHTGKDGQPIQTEGRVVVYLPDNGRDRKPDPPPAGPANAGAGQPG